MPIFTPPKWSPSDLSNTLAAALKKQPMAPAPAESHNNLESQFPLANVGLGVWDMLKGMATNLATKGKEAIDMMDPMTSVKQLEAAKAAGATPTDIIKDRFAKTASVASLGVSDVFNQELTRQNIKTPTIDSDTNYVWNPLKAMASTGAEMFGRASLEKASGKVRTGINPDTGDFTYREASPAERQKAIGELAMFAVPAVKAFGIVKRAAYGELPLAMAKNPLDNPVKTYSSRELDSGQYYKNVLNANKADYSPEGTPFKDTGPNVDLSVEDYLKLHGEVTKKATLPTAIDSYIKNKGQVKPTVAEVLSNIPDEDLGKLAVDNGWNVGETSAAISEALDRSSSQTGQKSAVSSVTKAMLDAGLVQRAAKGDLVASNAVKSFGILDGINRAETFAKVKSGSLWDKTKYVVGQGINTAIASAISLPFSAVRNLESNAAAIGLRQISNSIGEGIASKLYSIPEDPALAKTIENQAIEHVATAMQGIDEAGIARLKSLGGIGSGEDILAKLPATNTRLFGANSFGMQSAILKGSEAAMRSKYGIPGDIANALGSGLKNFTDQYRPSAYGIDGGVTGLVKTAAGSIGDLDNFAKTVDAAQGMLTGMNRHNESLARKYTFLSELARNGGKVGYKSLQDINAVLTGLDEVPAPLRSAIAEAEQTALKDTFSYRYTDGISGGILDFYDKTGPIMKLLGPTFPRFAVNAWRLTNDYSPMNMLELFNPEFRNVLQEGAAGGFKTVKAQKVLGQAVTGSALMAGMLMLRNSNIGGAKYYEFNTNQGETKRDLRQYPIISQYAALADITSNLMKGIPLSSVYSPNEFLEMLSGVRRFADMQIFNLDEIFKAVAEGEDDKIKKVVGQPIGRIASMFATPMSAIRELAGGVEQHYKGYVPKGLVYRDTTDSPIVGQITGKLPEFGDIATENPGDRTRMQPRVNMFTGKEDITDNPFQRQLFGQNVDRTTKLEEFIKRLPGLEPADLHHQYKDPRATYEIDKLMGQYLNTKTANGSTMSDFIINQVNKPDVTDESKAEGIRAAFKDIREAALNATKEKYPKYFFEEAVASTPGLSPSQRDAMIRKFRRDSVTK